MAIELNKDNLEETIKNGVTLIDFWAPWCGPCRMISPVIDELYEDYKNNDNVTIAKINTDDNQDLAVKYGVRSIPFILFIKNGEVMDQLIGAQSKQVLKDKIENLI